MTEMCLSRKDKINFATITSPFFIIFEVVKGAFNLHQFTGEVYHTDLLQEEPLVLVKY